MDRSLFQQTLCFDRCIVWWDFVNAPRRRPLYLKRLKRMMCLVLHLLVLALACYYSHLIWLLLSCLAHMIGILFICMMCTQLLRARWTAIKSKVSSSADEVMAWYSKRHHDSAAGNMLSCHFHLPALARLMYLWCQLPDTTAATTSPHHTAATIFCTLYFVPWSLDAYLVMSCLPSASPQQHWMCTCMCEWI